MRIIAPLRSLAACALLVGAVAGTAQAQATAPIIGRWDLTVQGTAGAYPSWVEVSLSGVRTLVGRFVGGGGSARPIARVEFANGTMRFAIPPQWDREETDLKFEAVLESDALTGTITNPNGEKQPFTGKRAPLLRRSAPVVWGAPVPLFNGKDLAGWKPSEGTNQWKAVDGVLQNARGGSNLITTATYNDFKLHVEFKYPKGGNSGIYLRGRYEVQVEDVGNLEPLPVHLGGIYGFLVPNENVARGPDVWQTFDITLIGRRVTVVLNGKTIIGDQTIPGITGGALDSDESAPGPIYLQGDHGPVAYRNMIITPAKSGAR
ncbi:MAG: DUF1080 domain-containing protein [Gemmatimonadaceae bacterium]|nr:DUF1080 domain-containing protein [Gemmatimonadaceae bacterium]